MSRRIVSTIKEAIVLPKNEAGFVRFHDTTSIAHSPQTAVVPGVTDSPWWCHRCPGVIVMGLPFSLNPPPVLSIPLLGHHPILLSSPLPSLSPFL